MPGGWHTDRLGTLNRELDRRRSIGSAGRLRALAREELSTAQVRRSVVVGVARLIPPFVGNRLRTAMLRLTGWQIGSGVVFFGAPRVLGSLAPADQLQFGPEAAINVGCTFEVNDTVVLGANVSLGPDVMILTSSHHLGPSARRAGTMFTAPVRIEDGAWIGARSVIFPGVTVGPGAVVSANSVVNKDVPANAVVAGVPATVVVKRLPG